MMADVASLRTRAARLLTRSAGAQDARGRASYGALARPGGIVNTVSGMGGPADKSAQSFFAPTRFYSEQPLEILGVQSWAARNFIDIPIDDQFIEWRTFSGDESKCDAMVETELRHQVCSKLGRAMKAARQYGTGVCVMMTREDKLTTPLRPERIRPGDLGNLLVLNRYEMSVAERDRDMMSPTFARPVFYDLYPKIGGGGTRVHASRVLRFDGITANTDSGFSVYDLDWGVPSLVPILLALTEDQTVVSAMAHLTQEASIPILKVSDLRAALSGSLSASDPDAPDASAIGEAFNRLKSIYRVAMLDKEEEEFERVAVSFGGLAEILDRFDKRVAAAAKIPITRWMGQSPAGMNATGESDMANYVFTVEAEREKVLTPVMDTLDTVLARDCGIGECPDWEWGTLLDMSEEQKAATAKTKAEAVVLGLSSYLWSEDEGREMLAGDPVFGPLAGGSPMVAALDDAPLDLSAQTGGASPAMNGAAANGAASQNGA